jgi:uncharacterized membrane protein YciS (DUF1049 family)
MTIARLLWLLAVVVIMGVAVLVAVANRGDVTFRMDPIPLEMDLPLYAVIFASLILGVILGWVMAALSYVRKRRWERAQEKARLAASLSTK